MTSTARLAPALLLLALLAGCEMLCIESPEKLATAKEGEGKAVGSACRHANRAIEDCYGLNPKAQKSAVFAGWREMDEYMRDNKLEAVLPVLARAAGKGDAPPQAAAESAAAERKPAANAAGKAAHNS